jgi:tetratricopeptide (TPR) repeat protein
LAFAESALLRVERLDPHSADAAENIVQLAETQRRLGKFEAAEDNLLEAAAIYLDLGKQYAIRIATIQNNLGLLYQETGRYSDAERLHRQAILSARQERNEHNPNTAIYSRGLGDLYVRVGELEGAEELYRYALDVLEQTVGSDNIETRLTRDRLREVSARLGRPEAPGEETFR